MSWTKVKLEKVGASALSYTQGKRSVIARQPGVFTETPAFGLKIGSLHMVKFQGSSSPIELAVTVSPDTSLRDWRNAVAFARDLWWNSATGISVLQGHWKDLIAKTSFAIVKASITQIASSVKTDIGKFGLDLGETKALWDSERSVLIRGAHAIFEKTCGKTVVPVALARLSDEESQITHEA